MKKILSSDRGFHYLCSICWIQPIRWIHIILKPEKEKHECKLSSTANVVDSETGADLRISK